MPKKKPEKKLAEMTSQELAERLFSPELKGKLDEIAHKNDSKPDRKSSQK